MSQITVHILNTTTGLPATGVPVSLFDQSQGDTPLAESVTNSDGRVPDLLKADTVLPAGTYRMHFAITDYMEDQKLPCFYPWVDVVFQIEGDGSHYHIPLLLSPYGYSTYRGS